MKNKNSNKKMLITIIACFVFIITVFSYTIIFRVTHVTGMDSTKYHMATEKYMNTETYH